MALNQGISRTTFIRNFSITLWLIVFWIAPLPSSDAAWVTNSPLLTARYSHTTTLLQNGKLLVAGGWNSNYLSSAELYDLATGKRMSTTAMTAERSDHTATLLPNGKILVAGGYQENPPFRLSSAEVYDPISETWTTTLPMTSVHAFHTSTLLRDGQILIAGGGDNVSHKHTDLYDPANGTWTASGQMKNSRGYHTATLLMDGRVLVAGGDIDDLPTAEIYDPVTGSWTNTVAMTSVRGHHTATLLRSGKVLVAGGLAPNPIPGGMLVSLSTAEIFDPTTGIWTPTTNSLTTARGNHTASLLPNGDVMVVGGFKDGPGAVSSVELFNPITESWSVLTNSLNCKRWGHTTTLLPGGRIMSIGGIGSSVTNSVETYDYVSGFWTNTSSMATGRTRHTSTLLPNGRVLVAGGQDQLYEPSTGVWTNTGSLSAARSYHTATLLPSGKVLIAGGRDTFLFLSSAAVYNPTNGNWSAVNSMSTTRWFHTATLLRNGKVLVAGGAVGVVATNGAEFFDPATGEWTKTGSMIYNRDSHSATLLSDGKVLVAGGNATATGMQSPRPAELYDPATGQWTETGQLVTRRADHTATLLPNGKVLITGGLASAPLSSAELYDPSTGIWSFTAPMSTARWYHAATLLPNGMVLVQGGKTNTSPSTQSLSTAELYNPITETWVQTGAMATPRHEFTATLLPDMKVLIAGGRNTNGILSSAELYDSGLGFSNSWRPQVATNIAPLNLGNGLTLTGSGFRGISGASSGNSQDSSSDYPVVQFRSIESGQITFLQSTDWLTNSFASVPVWNFPPGHAMATMFANGIASTSSIVNISVPIPTTVVLNNPKILTNGFQFAFTNSSGSIFGAWATTNLSLPFTNWTALGGATEVYPGQFQFTDRQEMIHQQRFYKVRAP